MLTMSFGQDASSQGYTTGPKGATYSENPVLTGVLTDLQKALNEAAAALGLKIAVVTDGVIGRETVTAAVNVVRVARQAVALQNLSPEDVALMREIENVNITTLSDPRVLAGWTTPMANYNQHWMTIFRYIRDTAIASRTTQPQQMPPAEEPAEPPAEPQVTVVQKPKTPKKFSTGAKVAVAGGVLALAAGLIFLVIKVAGPGRAPTVPAMGRHRRYPRYPQYHY